MRNRGPEKENCNKTKAWWVLPHRTLQSSSISAACGTWYLSLSPDSSWGTRSFPRRACYVLGILFPVYSLQCMLHLHNFACSPLRSCMWEFTLATHCMASAPFWNFTASLCEPSLSVFLSYELNCNKVDEANCCC